MGEELLIKAYNEDFRESLRNIRIDIEKEIISFLEHLQSTMHDEKRFFDNVESRIKSIKSFIEKVKRKNYSNIWSIKSSIEENQSLICEMLTDLIGFRINCYFKNDEEILYNALKDYYNEHGFNDDITLNFSENTIQKNGHKIFKVSGKFRNKYCFELQIKSLIHNLWGEVEHKSIYKNCKFDTNINSKKLFTEEIFNILSASDKQLLTIFNENQTEKQLVQALFFLQTFKSIEEVFQTKVLANHYNNFFKLFDDFNIYKILRVFVGTNLSNSKFEKYDLSKYTYSDNIIKFKEEIDNEFQDYNMNIYFSILSVIFNFKDYDNFKNFLSNYILEKLPDTADELSTEDAFEETEVENKESINDLRIKYLETFLENREVKA